MGIVTPVQHPGGKNPRNHSPTQCGLATDLSETTGLLDSNLNLVVKSF